MDADPAMWLALVAVIYPVFITGVWIPFALWHWRRFESPKARLSLGEASTLPSFTILVPCFNEAPLIEETLRWLGKLDYPEFEVIAINDGSRDGTGPILDRLAGELCYLRVHHQPGNQGKAAALNAALPLARYEWIVCIDADALLDSKALRAFARQFQLHPEAAALTGNPRVRNRASLLGKVQVGELSAVIGLIKRAQQVLYGRIFTVSGVVCAFRRSVLREIGGWNTDMSTEDIDITWRIQLAGWTARYEPEALCWILMPETPRGLWKQRLRWARGGSEVLLRYFFTIWSWSGRHLWPLGFELLMGVIWSYSVACMAIWDGAAWVMGQAGNPWPSLVLIPEWARFLMGMVCVTQFAVGCLLDYRFEPRKKPYFWLIWYPAAYWIIGAATTVVGFMQAIFRKPGLNATWVSPDRGTSSAHETTL